MKPEQIKAINQRRAMLSTEKLKEEIRLQVIRQITASMLLTLHDKWGWKPEDLNKIMHQVLRKFDYVADKYVKIEDFYETLREIGIEVKEDAGES